MTVKLDDLWKYMQIMLGKPTWKYESDCIDNIRIFVVRCEGSVRLLPTAFCFHIIWITDKHQEGGAKCKQSHLSLHNKQESLPLSEAGLVIDKVMIERP